MINLGNVYNQGSTLVGDRAYARLNYQLPDAQRTRGSRADC